MLHRKGHQSSAHTTFLERFVLTAYRLRRSLRARNTWTKHDVISTDEVSDEFGGWRREDSHRLNRREFGAGVFGCLWRRRRKDVLRGKCYWRRTDLASLFRTADRAFQVRRSVRIDCLETHAQRAPGNAPLDWKSYLH